MSSKSLKCRPGRHTAQHHVVFYMSTRWRKCWSSQNATRLQLRPGQIATQCMPFIPVWKEQSKLRYHISNTYHKHYSRAHIVWQVSIGQIDNESIAQNNMLPNMEWDFPLFKKSWTFPYKQAAYQKVSTVLHHPTGWLDWFLTFINNDLGNIQRNARDWDVFTCTIYLSQTHFITLAWLTWTLTFMSLNKLLIADFRRQLPRRASCWARPALGRWNK